jgi:hypothetical protein
LGRARLFHCRGGAKYHAERSHPLEARTGRPRTLFAGHPRRRHGLLVRSARTRSRLRRSRRRYRRPGPSGIPKSSRRRPSRRRRARRHREADDPDGGPCRFRQGERNHDDLFHAAVPGARDLSGGGVAEGGKARGRGDIGARVLSAGRLLCGTPARRRFRGRRKRVDSR